jgi:integrase
VACRVGEVLKLTPADIDDRKFIIQDPKSGKESEVVYIPRKLQDRLKSYVRDKDVELSKKIFPISYNTAWKMVKNSGKLVGVSLRPHDLRRHAATYASRSGTPIEIISEVILRHADLSTTQRYLGKVNEVEAIRWLENMYG